MRSRGSTYVSRIVITAAVSFVLSGFAWADVLEQSESRARFGEKDFAYFFIEAEDYHDNNPHGDGEAWLLSSDPASVAVTVSNALDPITGDPLEEDPEAFASGDESITNALADNTVSNETGGGHDIQYLLQFDTPGVYYLYIRHHSPLGPENDRNKNDSFYVPVEFGESPRQLKANGDDYGMLESVEFPGDTFTRGPWVWFAARQFVENSEQNPPIDQNPDTFLEWEITEDMMGEELILEFDHRENGTMLDAFLFIEVDSGIPPTNGEGTDGTGFRGEEDEVDIEFGLSNLNFEPEPPGPSKPSFVRGDCTNDDEVNITDAVCTLDFLFGGRLVDCIAASDSNGDAKVDLTDAVAVLGFLFSGGPNPVAPFPDCGPGELPSDETLGCETPRDC